jgi:tRNA(His) guanylyltransferase
MAKKDGFTVGDRMKRYEAVFNAILPRRVPVIIRLDGRAFHTVTRRLYGKTWSQEFVDLMTKTAKAVYEDLQGCEFAYSQSDEISFLLTDYRKISTDAWFSYEVNKMVSISASLASVAFSKLSGMDVCFDSRVFSVPQDDVCNYFLWRQLDATRNAIQQAGQENYSHKELYHKNCSEIQEMLFKKGINFNNYPIHRKRGWCITDGFIDFSIPIFSKDRKYVEGHVFIRED